MVNLKVQNCTVQILPANHHLSGKIQLKAKRGEVEWKCPECNAKNYIKLKNLPYKFKGGDEWSRVIRGAAYARELEKLSKSKCDLIFFLVKKAELKLKYLNIAGKELQVKRAAAVQIKEECCACGIKIKFNVEISADSWMFPFLSFPPENSMFENLEVEILPEDDAKIIRQIMDGYRIYNLMENCHLTISNDNVLRKINWKGSSQNFLKLIENLKNDMEKTVLFKVIEDKVEEIMKEFKNDEIAIYFSDIISFIRETRRTVFRRIRRKLFLSLGWLERQIESVVMEKIGSLDL